MMIRAPFPYFALGTIVRGFGRGSKELGCPTANLDEATVENLPASLEQGVYFGWAQLGGSKPTGPYKMVTSIGTNPFYDGQKKTIETHILHKFADDFYGATLKIALLGRIRPMTTFQDTNALMVAIQNDITVAERELDRDQCRQYVDHPFFQN